MKIQTKIFVIAILAILLPGISVGEWGGKAWSQHTNYALIDPLDTLDEEDFEAMRDTSLLTRRNLADETNSINALDYVLKDRYSPKHHTFDHKWYDHIYLGGSLGLEKINPQSDAYKFRTMTQINFLAGKQLDKYNSLRLSLGGGWGYQQDKNLWLKRIQLKLDYLYNLSTFFAGYNPARRVEASLLFGVGGNYSWMTSSDKYFSPEAHFGVQVKCYTGPLGTINLEPYIGISSDQIDVSGTRNWRGYDIFYGLNVNYSFYLVDNLSKEARQQLLESRMADDRMVDPKTLEKWRTPWFVEYSMGPVMSRSDNLGFSKTMGNQTTISVGRWLSPVMGFRLSAITRTTKWQQVEVAETNTTAGYTKNYNSHYFSGRLEALINPFGFFKSFKWNAPYGAYIAFGGEMGTITKYMPYGRLKTKSESYDFGAHFWYAISEDLQAFVEPRFTHNVYNVPYSNVNMQRMFRENNFGIDLGLTMLIRSEKYHDLYEMDNTQNYTYRNIRGTRIGISGGLPVFQRKDVYYNSNSKNWNLMGFVEYRFNELHTVRAQAELLTTNGNALLGYNDRFTTPEGKTSNVSRTGIWNLERKMLFGSLNYEVSLTNLCSGRFLNRKLELEAFAGPAVGVILKTKASINPAEPMDAGEHLVSTNYEDSKSPMVGADLGFKLSMHIWKGISAFLTPTTYLLYKKDPIPGLNTVSLGDFHIYQTLNLGLQYKIGKLRRNQVVVRRIHRRQDHNWKVKQIEAEHKYAEKLAKMQAKRKAKYYSK